MAKSTPTLPNYMEETEVIGTDSAFAILFSISQFKMEMRCKSVGVLPIEGKTLLET